MSDPNAATKAFEALASEILSGTRLAGAPLPSIRKLAQQRTIDPNTANKSLSRLVEAGLAHQSPERTGTKIVAPTPPELARLRTAVRTAIDQARESDFDLQTLLLLTSGLWEQQHSATDADRFPEPYTRSVPAELVLGGEPHHDDQY